MILNLSERKVSLSFSLEQSFPGFHLKQELPLANRPRKKGATRGPRAIAVKVDFRNTHNSVLFFFCRIYAADAALL